MKSWVNLRWKTNPFFVWWSQWEFPVELILFQGIQGEHWFSWLVTIEFPSEIYGGLTIVDWPALAKVVPWPSWSTSLGSGKYHAFMGHLHGIEWDIHATIINSWIVYPVCAGREYSIHFGWIPMAWDTWPALHHVWTLAHARILTPALFFWVRQLDFFLVLNYMFEKKMGIQ